MLSFSDKSRWRARNEGGRGPGRGLAPLSQPQAEPSRRAEPPPAEPEAEAPAPKGWHDSSSDLKRGLDVVEDVPVDALPPEWQVAPARGR